MFPHVPAAELAVARVASIDGNKVHTGDVVYLRHSGVRRAGELVLHLRARDTTFSIVSLGAAARNDQQTERTARACVADAPQIFPTS